MDYKQKNEGQGRQQPENPPEHTSPAENGDESNHITHDPTKAKKTGQLSRTLKAHDLDSLLVYGSRHRGPVARAPIPPPAKPATSDKFMKPKLKKEVKVEKAQSKVKEKGKQVVSQASQTKYLSPEQAKEAQAKKDNLKSLSKVPVKAQKAELIPQPRMGVNKEDEPALDKEMFQVPLNKTDNKNSQIGEKGTVVRAQFATDKLKRVPVTIEVGSSHESEEAVSSKLSVQIDAPRRKRFPIKKKTRRYSQDSDFSGKNVVTEFPITNYISPEVQRLYLLHASEVDRQRNQRREQGHTLNSSTFISCDVKYFNWNFFVDKVGSFDVVLIDPPWRIKGAQQNDSQFMFSNCKFNLQYNTMSNKDIGRVGIDKLSDCGFIFLWILNTQLDASIELMNGWGYELVDQIIWVKTKDHKVYLTHGYYFMHSYEICLVGYKSHPNKQISCLQGITSNVLIAEVRKKSQKPDQLYELVELMFPASKKVEVFARNNNLRFGWFSLGNQLGESFDKWLLMLHCDRCNESLKPNMKRYKAKKTANYDLCENCVVNQNREDFFEILNQADEDIIHLYRSCDHCGTQPIWGTRFECVTCHNFDLCENCYDLNLTSQQKFHDVTHETNIVELPLFGHGFNLHDFKCNSCFQKPIIGICFSCKSCRYNLCQMCFFERNAQHSTKRGRQQHHMEAIFDPSARPLSKKFTCFNCKINLKDSFWMCENCYGFFFCNECHDKRAEFKTQQASSHKNYHHFVKIE